MFLNRHAQSILNYPSVKCDRSLEVEGRQEFSLSGIPWDIICPAFPVWILVSSFSAVLCMTVLMMISYFKNKNLIFAFLYAHLNSVFRFLSDEDDLDETKKFDSFVSCATSDCESAMDILRELESNVAENLYEFAVPFRLCFHERDFVSGETIDWHIHNAVQNSRLTILILSKKFLDSPWLRIEFKAAYDQI